MKHLFLFSLCVLTMSPLAVSAMEFVSYERYNDMVQLEPGQTDGWYFGELMEFPHTYVFTIDEAQPVSFSILVPADDAPEILPGVLIVRQATRGVDEVARLRAKDMSWEEWHDGRTNDTYLKGGTYIAEWLEPGSYLLEVQTPTNSGKYALQVGNDSPTAQLGYFQVLSSLPALKRWHGKASIMIITSPYVYIPLGLLIVVALGVWWYRRKQYA